MTLPRRFVPVSLVAASLAALAGCVSSDDIEGLHRQMSDIETQIQALERKSNTNVSQQTSQLLKSNADTGVKLNELTVKMEQLEAKLEDTNRRLSQLSQQIAETQGDLARLRSSAAGTAGVPRTAPGGSPEGAPDATARPGGPSPSELYDTAYGDYSKGRYALAIQGFGDYLKAYPNTDLSDDAQYWIGESHYAQKSYREAVAAFDKLLRDFPKSNRAPAALLKKAYALIELGQRPEAVVQLQYVMHEYTASDEARLARAKLKTLGIEAR